MTKNYNHNRQLPLASKYEDEIRNEEMRATEAILAKECMTRVARKATAMTCIKRSNGPESVSADIVTQVTTYTKTNPGPGAWAASIVTAAGFTAESDYFPSMTKPLLELEAMIAVLTVIESCPGTVAVHTTAKWIVEYLNNGQVETWKANNWRKASGGSVAHVESWKELFRLFTERSVQVAWVESDTTPEMKKCGALAKRAFRVKKSLS